MSTDVGIAGAGSAPAARPRQVIEAISGIMAAMFVVMVSSTVVATPMQSAGGAVPDIAALCDPVRPVVEGAFGDSIAVITVLCTVFLPNRPLSRKNATEQIEEELGAELAALEPAEEGGEGYRELVETGAIRLVDAEGSRSPASGRIEP